MVYQPSMISSVEDNATLKMGADSSYKLNSFFASYYDVELLHQARTSLVVRSEYFCLRATSKRPEKLEVS
jgi:hypothetical protein